VVYLNALVFVALFYFMRPFIVLIYTFIEHDVEAWACLLSNHGRNRAAGSLCRELRAARYLLIPLLALGIAFLSVVVWQRLRAWRKMGIQDADTIARARADSVERKV
jgi:hypothetical protein